MFSAKDARLMSDYNREKEYFKQKKYEKKSFKKLVKEINNAIRQSVKNGSNEVYWLCIKYDIKDVQKKLKDIYEPLGYNLSFDRSSWMDITVCVTW